MNVETLKRMFVFNGRLLADPNSEFSVEEVLEHYSGMFPRLLGGKIQPPKEVNNELHFELVGVYGDKG